MSNEILKSYQSLTNQEKLNLHDYMIFYGIYEAYSEITDDEAEIIHDQAWIAWLKDEAYGINEFGAGYNLAEGLKDGVWSIDEIREADKWKIMEMVGEYDLYRDRANCADQMQGNWLTRDVAEDLKDRTEGEKEL